MVSTNVTRPLSRNNATSGSSSKKCGGKSLTSSSKKRSVAPITVATAKRLNKMLNKGRILGK